MAIYNENTFEDFESVLSEEIEKIKKINKDLVMDKSEEEIEYIQLALKELLYLDDEEEFNFEFKKYGEKSDDEFEIIFEDNLIQKYFSGNNAKYKFLVHNVQILFSNQKLEGNNFIEIKKEQLNDGKYLENIFEENNKEIVIKYNEQKIKIDNDFFNEIKVEKYNESNKNINKLYYANVQIGFKESNGEEKIFQKIKIKDLEIKEELKTNMYIEIIGIITSESKNNDKIIKRMITELKKSITKI